MRLVNAPRKPDLCSRVHPWVLLYTLPRPQGLQSAEAEEGRLTLVGAAGRPLCRSKREGWRLRKEPALPPTYSITSCFFLTVTQILVFCLQILTSPLRFFSLYQLYSSFHILSDVVAFNAYPF